MPRNYIEGNFIGNVPPYVLIGGEMSNLVAGMAWGLVALVFMPYNAL